MTGLQAALRSGDREAVRDVRRLRAALVAIAVNVEAYKPEALREIAAAALNARKVKPERFGS